MISVEGRKHIVKKGRHHNCKNKKDKSNKGHCRSPDSSPAPAPLPGYGSNYPTGSKVFDVLSFGAKGDGVSDDAEVI